MEIALPVRFYRAVPSADPLGHLTEEWSLDLARVAFVSLHCWNVGCPGGPPVPPDFWVDLGSLQNHEVGWQVLTQELLPALQAARRIGMTVVHVQPESIGARYPHLQPPVPERKPHPGGRGPISDHQSRRASRVHGEGYMEWPGWRDLDFAVPVRPLETETVVVDTDQWDCWMRERGIDTLIYTGFATNLCILDAPGGMRLMCGLGYRCIILREATLGVEMVDTLADRLQTRAALNHIEAWVGYTASTRDFLRACGEVR